MNDNAINILSISNEDVKKIFKGKTKYFLDLIEESFVRYYNGNTLLPDKISQVFDEETQIRINCMAATAMDEKICGVKWVSVFPTNAKLNKQNVSGITVLSEINNGFPIAVIDASLTTTFRTAAVGAIAAKYLANKDSEAVGFIGAGAEARMHFVLLKHIYPNIKKCYVSSRTVETENKFAELLGRVFPDVEFIRCETNMKNAIVDSDIIVTATSTQKDLLKADWIKKGAFYIHVGGWEDEYAVVDKASKIVCDRWDCVKHRTQTLSRMFKAGLLTDDDIYCDLADIVAGQKPGRTSDDEFIYFNSVGLAFVDIYLANEIYNEARKSNLGVTVTLQENDDIPYDIFK